MHLLQKRSSSAYPSIPTYYSTYIHTCQTQTQTQVVKMACNYLSHVHPFLFFPVLTVSPIYFPQSSSTINKPHIQAYTTASPFIILICHIIYDMSCNAMSCHVMSCHASNTNSSLRFPSIPANTNDTKTSQPPTSNPSQDSHFPHQSHPQTHKNLPFPLCTLISQTTTVHCTRNNLNHHMPLGPQSSPNLIFVAFHHTHVCSRPCSATVTTICQSMPNLTMGGLLSWHEWHEWLKLRTEYKHDKQASM